MLSAPAKDGWNSACTKGRSMSALRRFFVRPESVTGERVTVVGPQAHHMASVLRLRPGDRVLVLDGSSLERVIELDQVSNQEVTGRIIGTQAGSQSPLWVVTVLQGVPKGVKMDTIIRMGTELGVAQFVPVHFHRSIATGGQRTERWRRIALEAAKQSRRSDVPIVYDPLPLPEALQLVAGYDRILIFWEGELTRTIAEGLASAPTVGRVAVIVGPEGGLEAAEVAAAARAGAVPVSLGPLILRTETAAVVAVAMVLYELTIRGQRTTEASTHSPLG